MTRDLTRKTLGGVAWIGGASVVRLGLRVIAVAILARLLTPREYGIVGGAVVAFELATMLYSLGLAATLIQRKEIAQAHVATALGVSLGSSVLAGALLFFAGPLLSGVMRIPELADILRVIAFLMPLGAFGMVCEALLARNRQTKSIALRPLVSFTVAAFAVAIPMASVGYGYWSLVGLQVTETILGAAAFALAARKLLVWPRFSYSAFSELWPMSLGFSLNQPLVYIVQNADKFMIARCVGADALGLYTRASFITTTASNMFADVARLTMFPAMSTIQLDKERLSNAILKSTSLIAFLTIPCSAFCIAYSNEIVELFLGARWEAAAVPLALLSMLLYIRIGMRNIYTLLQAIGAPYVSVSAHAGHALILVVGIAVAYPKGLSAVCIVVVFASTVTYMFLLLLARNRIALPLRKLIDIHLRPVTSAFGVIGLGLLLRTGGLTDFALLTSGAFGTTVTLYILLRLTPHLIVDRYCREFLISVPSIRKYVPSLARVEVVEKAA